MSKIIKTKHSDKTTYTINGVPHREDGPAIEYSNGDKFWYLNGVLHREDGPAVDLANGHKEWFLNGNRHRENGPARELVNVRKEYWVNGQYLDFITNDQMLIYYLKYGFLK